MVNLLIKQGVDVIRINLAHVPLNDVKTKFIKVKLAILKAERARLGRYVGILADLPGPKIRFRQEPWLLPTRILRRSMLQGRYTGDLAPSLSSI